MTGAGIPKEKVEQVKNLLDEDCNSSICIGLHNVNRRIQFMYGKEYGLDILSEENAVPLSEFAYRRIGEVRDD